MLYKRGNIWWTKFMLDGKLRRYSCKTNDKTVAQEVAAALNADVVRNRFDVPVKYKKECIFCDIWLEYIRFTNITITEYKSDRSKHFLPVFGKKNISDITDKDIENYKLHRKIETMAMPKNAGKREQDISFRSVNMEISILHNFFNYCIKCGYIDKNPASGIKRLNELSRLKTLSDEDINKLISGSTNKLTRDLITFLIYTGCRKGEALNLKWDDVDLQNNVIAIKGTKTKYDRYIPISKPLKAILGGIEKKYVFRFNWTAFPFLTGRVNPFFFYIITLSLSQ